MTYATAREQRRLQLSLRTMLLLVAALALLLGVHFQPARRQSRAAAALRQLGATVIAEPAGPAWPRGLIGQDFFVNVTEVRLIGGPATDVDSAN